MGSLKIDASTLNLYGSSWGELVALCWELERYASNTPRGLRVLIQLTCVTLECCLDHASLILRLKPKYCIPLIYASPQNVTLITLLMKCAMVGDSDEEEDDMDSDYGMSAY